jgi:LAGLIDADG DNA endonuclease family
VLATQANILGDLYLLRRKFSPKANVRLVFRQSFVNSSYLFHLYKLFQDFVTTPPSVSEVVDKKTGKSRFNLCFTTLALPCFNEIYNIFI